MATEAAKDVHPYGPNWGTCPCGRDHENGGGVSPCEECSMREASATSEAPTTGRRDYAVRRAARVERLQARAERLRKEGNSRIAGADRVAAMIPVGQPVLVGHHSERRHRRDLARIRDGHSKGFGLLKEAQALERRAASSEANAAISSDDPDAIVKLKAKVAESERQRDAILAANKQLRAGATLEAVAPLFYWWRDPLGSLLAWRSLGHRTISTANISAELRRLHARIAELTSRAAAPERATETIGAVSICEESNRVQLHFPGKPTESVRTELKRSGFRWAPSEGAWQRHASEQAWREARRIAALV